MHSPIVSALRGPLSRTRDWWKHQSPGTAASLETPGSSPRTSNMDHRRITPNRQRPIDPDIRADLVARVRREIAEGTYETPEKWEQALDRLVNRLEDEEDLG